MTYGGRSSAKISINNLRFYSTDNEAKFLLIAIAVLAPTYESKVWLLALPTCLVTNSKNC